MKILLVTMTDNLSEKLAALNPELNFCAAVVDNVEAAKEFLPQVPLYPMSQLQKLLTTLEYDYVLLVQEEFYGMGLIRKLQSYGLPTDKLISFAALTGVANWQAERQLRYYHEHAQDFKIFATGTSYTEAGIDIRRFKYKAFNFGTSSQDLYYSYNIAKGVILCGGGILRYAMRSSVLRLMFSTSTFPKRISLKAECCPI